MRYTVKEVFFSLQGEGARVGTPCVFVRFAGCNLWSGREADRAQAVCRFCDTDFVGGERYRSADQLAAVARSVAGPGCEWVVCTGGEPLLQLDRAAVDALHRYGFRIALETNGTLPMLEGIDWVCVSPKARARLVVERGDEIKVVYPQADQDLTLLGDLDFAHRFLQPMDGPRVREHTAAAIRYCLEHPRWRLSLQTHKLVGIR